MIDEQLDVVTKALRRAWSLGQRYWSQADSQSSSQHRRADETQLTFQRLVEDTRAALASDHALACTASNDPIAGPAAPQAAVCELKRELAMGKRELLSDDEILDIATAAGLRFSTYSDDVETRAAIKRLAHAVERAHGIGGSDE